MKKTLSGGVALITGSTRGIGKELARGFASSGMRVAVTGRSVEAAQSVARELGDACRGFALEVTEQASVESCVEAIEAELGPIDLLINNAGLLIAESCPWEVDAEDWWRVNEVNVKGVFLLSQAVLRRMASRGRGRVINMASDTAIKPFPTLSAYATSKAALLRMTDSFAAAAEPLGLSLFAVSPGMVKTEMTALLPNAAEIPASTWTAPEKIVELCRYLASGRADSLNGRYFHVNRDDIEACVAQAKQIRDSDSHVLRLSLGIDCK